MDDDITLLCNDRRWRYSHSYIISHCLNRAGNTFGNDRSGDRSCITLIRVIRFCDDHDCIIIQIVVRRCQFTSASYLCISLIRYSRIIADIICWSTKGSWGCRCGRVLLDRCSCFDQNVLCRNSTSIHACSRLVDNLRCDLCQTTRCKTCYAISCCFSDNLMLILCQYRNGSRCVYLAVACNIGCCGNVLCHGQALCGSSYQKSACGSFGCSVYGSVIICQNGNVSCCCDDCSGDSCDGFEGVADLHHYPTNCRATSCR